MTRKEIIDRLTSFAICAVLAALWVGWYIAPPWVNLTIVAVGGVVYGLWWVGRK